MEFLSKLYNYVKSCVVGESSGSSATSSNSVTKQPIPLTSRSKTNNPNEITYAKDISDKEIERQKYIEKAPPKTHKVSSGNTLFSIARQYGVSVEALLAANPNLSKDSKLSLGQQVNIPQARKIKNVKNLKDVAKAMGLDENFVRDWKKSEDAPNTPANKFHNTPYKDNAGVLTIGIGHAIQNEKDKQEIIKKYGDLNLSDAEVCDLFASDLLEAEENLSACIGQNNYNKLPLHVKEALLDMTFNKGLEIIEGTPGLIYCLKNEKYEAAINKFTNIESAVTGKEMSGLAKRRLFDISLAIKMYSDKVPQSNINTAQALYNRGVELLRQECKVSGKKFEHQIIGFNKDIQSYFGDRIKINYVIN